ncbi:MAG TPA: NfeD family protein [Lachnospiraceae bacterium]|nr:NfeD family protein [Lachnospiraceae bacterium]
MNLAVLWLFVLIVLVAIEIATLGLTTIWFAGGALLATIAALLGAPLLVQSILFFVTSGIMLYFTRPIAVKYFNKDRVKTNIEGMIGKQAIVISEIDNIQGIGQVTVNGQEWSARASFDGVTLEVGKVATVVSVVGVKLIVEERKEGN